MGCRTSAGRPLASRRTINDESRNYSADPVGSKKVLGTAASSAGRYSQSGVSEDQFPWHDLR
jgi:hypothetical protein